MSKVCLTTYIYGLEYQAYIPFLLYSCHKAYPEYDVILFLYDELDDSIKNSIELLHLTNNVKIIEKQYSECKKMTPLKSQSLRWVLWDDDFNNYDYLYTVDIDILYIKEPVPLHIQHIEHMKVLGLPFSNIRRDFIYNPYSYKAIYRRLQTAGFRKLAKYFKDGKQSIDRLSGLHFVDRSEYYLALNAEKREKFVNDILSNNFLDYIMSHNDEVLLAYILKYISFDLNKLGIRKDAHKMLDFNNYKNKEFRPLHGIHLGVFRNSQNVNRSRSLRSSAYKHYIDVFTREVLNDETFLKLLNNAPESIKKQFDLLFEFIENKDYLKQ